MVYTACVVGRLARPSSTHNQTLSDARGVWLEGVGRAGGHPAGARETLRRGGRPSRQLHPRVRDRRPPREGGPTRDQLWAAQQARRGDRQRGCHCPLCALCLQDSTPSPIDKRPIAVVLGSPPVPHPPRRQRPRGVHANGTARGQQRCGRREGGGRGAASTSVPRRAAPTRECDSGRPPATVSLAAAASVRGGWEGKGGRDWWKARYSRDSVKRGQ